MVSIIFGYKDREVIRLTRCLESLREQVFQDFEVIIVDYGSASPNAARVKALADDCPFCRYVYTETRGRPWNRAHCLNIGIKLSKREYVFTCDMDMIFPSMLMKRLVDEIDPKSVFHVITNYLDKSFCDWDNIDDYPLKVENYGGRGILVIPRKVAVEIGGYDERYFHWGCEDNDLHARLKLHGLEVRKKAKEIFIHHQWHPISYGQTPQYIPDDLDGTLYDYYYKNKGKIIRNNGLWGEVEEHGNRKLISMLNFDEDKLNKDDDVYVFDEYPRDYFVQQKLVKFFYRAPKGSLLVIKNLEYPISSNLLDRGLNFINRFMFEKMGLKFGVGLCRNEIHRYVYLLIEANDASIDDYYFNFNLQGSPVTLILK